MKTKLYTLTVWLAILFFIALSSFTSPVQNIKAATVESVLGIPVFVMSEPETAYDVTGQVSDEDAASTINAINGVATYRTIKESCTVIITNALRKQKKGKFAFDAVIISDDGHNGTCIKWKDDTSK